MSRSRLRTMLLPARAGLARIIALICSAIKVSILVILYIMLSISVDLLI